MALIRRLLGAVEEQDRVDGPARAVQGAVQEARRGPAGVRVAEVLRGSWLGHPAHPLLVQLPIGAWLSAAVLDMVPGGQDAARRLVGVGLLAAPAAAAAGLAETSDLDVRQRRVAAVHALANGTAVLCYLGSYACRRAGRARAGRGLALLGLTAVAAGGALGGHLAYSQGAGVHRWK
ncbi:DUF2231 domain-containing protein [Allonocardiopsis opalescens]|uniref:Putative membrane protein n=1 Tax=Allonocardiopsis opalescens TaxID=1144618 RepID=A0A2T0Q7M0_9ACTN|nr:DUF2231 domain-containing protein [Allonocardiopsis opalescens]PRX99830.1 putative membrane protein [Allonocardiopsis opalescens]